MSSKQLKSDNFFVIRTPRLALEQLVAFGDENQDTNTLLSAWLATPGVEEAIYLASPSLLERIDQWRTKPDSKQGKKVAHALIKYMVRMCSRPTPFGLFSGIHQGKVDSQTTLTPAKHTKDTRKTRLDMFYLSALKEHFIKHASRSDHLTYKPNSSHYFIAEQCRYIETYLSDDTMQYRLSAVESDEYFKFALELAKPGLSFNALVSHFLAHYQEADQEEVENYIQDLIDEGVLLADIPLPLTGDSPDQALLKSIEGIKELDAADKLATALSQIEQLDNARSGEIAPYKQLLSHLENLPVKAQENKLFQSDIYRAFEQCQISEMELKRVQKQLEVIAGLTITSAGSGLSQFMTQFNSRFEGQFVPLDVILDDESGIGISTETGYEAPLVAGLNLARNGSNQATAPEVSMIDSIVERALSLPENRGKDCVVLKSKELKGKINNKDAVKSFPYSFGTMLSLYQDDRGNPVYKFNGCYGPSAANLLGRFCHLDPQLKESVTEHLTHEQSHSEDVIFAEVVHMPEGRPGNVIARPHLRQYEIVFMADSALSDEFQIPLSDLHVWVEGQKVKLWSKRLNKQVIPRLSSAHNYSARSLSAYKFLCMLQHQEGRAPHFSMPSSTERASFVPRVMLDNLILSEKTWRIERTELEAVNKKGQFNRQQLDDLMQKYQLDAQVSFAMADNVLQLDLRNPDMFAILLGESKGQTTVELKEVLTSAYRSRVVDSAGHHYNNEVIVPFFNEHAVVHSHFSDDPIANITAEPIKRRFSAGSEWLSLKIYSGNSLVEQLLTDELLPLIEQNAGLYDKWFFIRYGDPDWHIRLRFHGDPQLLCGQLLPRLNALLDPKIESGELHKVELMTYEREVERYGGPESMGLVESLFMFDSRLIAQSCALVEEYGEDIRWRVALACTHRLLNMFEYTDEARFALVSQLREGFGREFNETSALRKQLGSRYREYQEKLDDDFIKLVPEQANQCDEAQSAILNILEQWQNSAAPVIEVLNRQITEKQLNCTRDSLLNSLLHMHNNRMFKAYGREQELVIHDLLRRKYFSADKKA
ncbi:lantibiotic dehydratase [Pseudoalteromonas luteoviolacea]|uniref:Thiopeptide-type bacteriocin biosynthesis domain protein n=1 Tax=Pseudoalteromonas luteoviolacea (strain 2ta16) TaxID=1353533 RepID=V4HRP6_PSEL2|nr:lantibiotic dehydratase [Pseudoalteromonas luteoviolacea]ESP93490.1 thiopeptide-type bacteriocin biosynthesis domain protein [Pseudoalteromonas luteoviolacea 2ta16]KZN42481.1 lantibiotic dehydratase [Pseudoalteromonas luteoviolacea NCIMB 1944]